MLDQQNKFRTILFWLRTRSIHNTALLATNTTHKTNWQIFSVVLTSAVNLCKN